MSSRYKTVRVQMLLSRNINFRCGVNPDKDYYDITDSYLNQLIEEDTQTGKTTIKNNIMQESTYTIENMERLWYRDKSIYTNADPKWSIETGSSIKPQKSSYITEAKPKEPDDLFSLLKRMYPDVDAYTRQLEINAITRERNELDKIKKLAREEVEKAQRKMIEMEIRRSLGIN